MTTGGPIGRRLGAVAVTAAVERARELVRSAVWEQNLPEHVLAGAASGGRVRGTDAMKGAEC
jgi:hypothetical protein